MTYSQQVDKTHYEGQAYRSAERWMSYWHQLQLVRETNALTVLEIGLGEGVVARELKHSGVKVTTLDVAEDLHPDVVGSITAIPLADQSFDLVLAAEVLEHIQYADVPQALREMARVARTSAVISVPHPGWVFLLRCKLPLVPYFGWFVQIPFFWRIHRFNGEHYWELGKKHYPISRFLACAADAGLKLQKIQKFADDPGHRFFLFSK